MDSKGIFTVLKYNYQNVTAHKSAQQLEFDLQPTWWKGSLHSHIIL